MAGRGTSVRSRAPHSTSPVTRRVMLANLPGKSALERRLRRLLWARGMRYRREFQPLQGHRCRVDIAFPRQRLIVLVHGCFWHGCPEHFVAPKANSAWWLEKIQATRERDTRQCAELTSAGWRTVIVWEHQLVAGDAELVADWIASELRASG